MFIGLAEPLERCFGMVHSIECFTTNGAGCWTEKVQMRMRSSDGSFENGDLSIGDYNETCTTAVGKNKKKAERISVLGKQ